MPTPEPSECPVCHRADGTHKMGCRPQDRADAERYPEPSEDVREALTEVISKATYSPTWGECARAAERILSRFTVTPKPTNDNTNQ